MKSGRRFFLLQTLGVAAAAVATRPAFAQTSQLQESDPAAQALGYRSDATKVDKGKYPLYAAGAHCGNCQFFQGKATDANGGCALFGAKQVAETGWCNGYQSGG